jgi:hypothetical protein
MTDTLARMRQLVGTPAQWAANDLVIGAAEIALELQADGNSYRWKIGNGTKNYSQLAYQVDVPTLSGPAGAAQVGFVQSGAGAGQRTAQDKMRDAVAAQDFTGYDPTGVNDCTAILVAADLEARKRGRALRVGGTPRVKSTITLAAKTHWIFEGPHGAAAGDWPSSYLLKDAGLNGTCLVSNADGTKLEGGGICAESGNGGDLLQVKRNSFVWRGAPYFDRAGRDCIRIGDDNGPSNANGFYLEMPIVQRAGRHGINIDDKPSGAPDANGGLIARTLVQGAAQCGIRFGNANLGNVVSAPIVETCGTGLLFDTQSNRNVVVGGDIEANTTNVSYATPGNQYGNRLVNVTVQGVVVNSDHGTYAWTPVLVGATTAGAGTYTTQKGVYTLSDGVMIFEAEITWTAHTGTGQLYINLPNPLANSLSGGVSNPPTFIPVNLVTQNLTIPANAVPSGLVSSLSNPPQVRCYSYLSGVLTALALPASGTIYVSGVVPWLQSV